MGYRSLSASVPILFSPTLPIPPDITSRHTHNKQFPLLGGDGSRSNQQLVMDESSLDTLWFANSRIPMSRRSPSTSSYSIFTCSSLAFHCSTRSTTPVDKVRRGDIQGNIQLFRRMLGTGQALGFEACDRKSFHVSWRSPSLPTGFLPQSSVRQLNRNTSSPILVQRYLLAVSSRMHLRHHTGVSRTCIPKGRSRRSVLE